MDKQIVYVDMDNVLVDFASAKDKLPPGVWDSAEDKDEIPGIFALMSPINGALDAYKALYVKYDVYILSTSPWENPTALSEKLAWVKEFLGDLAYKRLILTHNKQLNKGNYLIDDRPNNGASEFEGIWIQFGSRLYPDWRSVLKYLEA